MVVVASVMVMAANKPRSGSFSRNFGGASSSVPSIPGLKHGPNGTMLLSSGIPDLDSNSFYSAELVFVLVRCALFEIIFLS